VEKFKFAVKAALSIALAFLIPFSQGWNQATTAATTIMLIAAMGSLGDSVTKGLLRVIGTVIGAIIGMSLIALFPQERMLYLLFASVIVTIILYFARAYQGDTTIFVLSGITIMTLFQNGEVDNVFLYGIDKTFMTIFGIAVYTFVGLFLWPVHMKDQSAQHAKTLTRTQHTFYQSLQKEPAKEQQEIYNTLLQEEQQLQATVGKTQNAASERGFSTHEWREIVESYRTIDETLLRLYTLYEGTQAPYTPKIPQIERLSLEVESLFVRIEEAWSKQHPQPLPQACQIEYDPLSLHTDDPLKIAAATTTLQTLCELHTHLRNLLKKLNAIHDPLPASFPYEYRQTQDQRFLWGDIEHLKATLVTFLIFWGGTLLWIYLNPPGGFMVVSLAVGLSVITAFTPVKPSLLMLLFSFAFIFAALMYVAVLPQLQYGWQLGIFLFVYAFIGFYFFTPELSIFFLMGMLTLGLSDTPFYSFDIFLMTLLMFYAFLSLLLLFYYIPFSTRPERLFLLLQERLYTIMRKLTRTLYAHPQKKQHFLSRLAVQYYRSHLISTVQKMKLWAEQIDEKYFSPLEKEALLAWVLHAERIAYRLEMLLRREAKERENPMIQTLLQKNGTLLQDAFDRIDTKESDPEQISHMLQTLLHRSPSSPQEKHAYIELFSYITMHMRFWESLTAWKQQKAHLNLHTLHESRF